MSEHWREIDHPSPHHPTYRSRWVDSHGRELTVELDGTGSLDSHDGLIRLRADQVADLLGESVADPIAAAIQAKRDTLAALDPADIYAYDRAISAADADIVETVERVYREGTSR